MSTIQSSFKKSRPRLISGRQPLATFASSGRHLAIALTSIVALEFVVIACAAYVVSYAYNKLFLLQSPANAEYISAALFISAITLLMSLSFRQFVSIPTQTLRQFVFSGIGAAAVSFVLFLSALFVFKVSGAYSRGTFLLQFAFVPLTVAVFRVGAFRWLRSAIARGYLEAARVILIGELVCHAPILASLRDQGVKVVGRFNLPYCFLGKSGAKNPTSLDTIRNIIEQCRSLNPDDILILPAENDLEKIAEFAGFLAEIPASIHVLPTGNNPLWAARVGELGTQPTLQLASRPLSMFQRVTKRAFDVTAAVFGLVILSPMLLLVSILIKLDSRGPVFFGQARHGYNNQQISVFKFRTMHVTEDGYIFNQATKDDPRITRVGRILRRSNIDELPQLLNVLLGEMSIVGPRPHAIAHNEEFEQRIAILMRRHKVKPGITGWAQVCGYRGETNTLEKMRRRVECDLFYIDNWSFLFDLQIIFLTLLSKRAYVNAG